MEKEDHDTKFDLEDVSYQDLLSSSKEADLKYDSEKERTLLRDGCVQRLSRYL